MSNLLALFVICSVIAFGGVVFAPRIFTNWGQKYRKESGICFGLVFALLVVSSAQAKQPNFTVQKAQLPTYKIVKEETLSVVKREVDVLLEGRVSKEVLAALARKIRSSTDVYERTFIGYRIKGENSAVYWATTHYNPDLKIVINGGTKEEVQKMQATSLNEEGTIVGHWVVTNGYNCKMTVSILSGKYFIKTVFADGSSQKDEYKLTKENSKLRLEKPNEFGEYFLIDLNGNLEFWDKDGKFYTATKL
jgi:hypothetical protein